MKRIGLVVGVLVVALFGAVLVRVDVIKDPGELVIVQWANSHPMRDGLLPQMAKDFNSGDHETSSGLQIKVVVISCDSSVQTEDLVSRVTGAGPTQHECKSEAGGRADDPTIVTPQSADWLVDVNHHAGRTVVDLQNTLNIAETWLGIVTHKEMASCLGWPGKELGYQDILDLRSNPLGWRAHADCAQGSWGSTPLLAFTNPTTSTSGRNVLVSLYAMAAHKSQSLDQLTEADIDDPDVVQYVKDFQQLVDHYMPGTIPLNTKVTQGTHYGHFFLMPEDNVVSLYNGTEKAIALDGTEQRAEPVQDLVMIYPKEGSVLNGNPAGVVTAPWVSGEQTDAARTWIDFLRSDAQQRKFTASGFRPASGTNVPIDKEQFAAWGLDADQPRVRIEPGDVPPVVLDKIMASWGSVKKPAVVTFVVDTSGSMDQNDRLVRAKDGLTRMLDAMSTGAGANNQVGLVTFSDDVHPVVRPAPLSSSKFDIADAIDKMEANGRTALYDAIEQAVRLTDDAAAPDVESTRAVVVLTDGAANLGRCLDTIVSMRRSSGEAPIKSFCGLDGGAASDEQGQRVSPEDVRGDELIQHHDHEVQVFFVGFGESDIDIGRILAQATNAEYRGSTEEDLAAVIEQLSGYF